MWIRSVPQELDPIAQAFIQKRIRRLCSKDNVHDSTKLHKIRKSFRIAGCRCRCNRQTAKIHSQITRHFPYAARPMFLWRLPACGPADARRRSRLLAARRLPPRRRQPTPPGSTRRRRRTARRRIQSGAVARRAGGRTAALCRPGLTRAPRRTISPP